jgi:transglutaminase-like putative cysteine protease
MLLSIEHATRYRYARPIKFGVHRLMIRPIEGHDVQIRTSGLSISAPHRIRWQHDIFGNSVALVEFLEPVAGLEVQSTVQVEQFNTNPFDFVLETGAVEFPVSYRDNEACDAAAFLSRQHVQDEEAIRAWIRPFLDSKGGARTLDFFSALTKSVPIAFQYNVREEPGVQSPGQTLNLRAGSCRDFALLFMEAARLMGVAARYVSGYLCRADAGGTLARASDATHAWVELYLPGAGWKGFDPTCGVLAADYHVRTAVTRAPEQAIPVAGTFEGRPEDYLGMDVTVHAVQLDPIAAEDNP